MNPSKLPEASAQELLSHARIEMLIFINGGERDAFGQGVACPVVGDFCVAPSIQRQAYVMAEKLLNRQASVADLAPIVYVLANVKLRPFAKKHPVALVVCAGLFGVALIRLKPWRMMGALAPYTSRALFVAKWFRFALKQLTKS